MRVALNGIADLDPKFGSRVYLSELARELTTIPGVEVVMIVGKHQSLQLPDSLRASSVEVDVPHGRSYWQCLHQSRIAAALKRKHVDIYHIPNSQPLLQRTGPTVITIHDLAELRVRKYGAIRRTYRRIINFIGAHLADVVITVSEHSKQDILNLLRVSSEKVFVVYQGVGSEFALMDRVTCWEKIRVRYGIDRQFILAPGGLSGNKNIERLLASFSIVRQSQAESTLVVTGHAESAALGAIRWMIRDLNLEGAVLLTGHIPREDLPYLYNCASVAVYPSLYEGFGLPIIEAMACGAPLVASNVSSIPEIAGNAALLVDPYDPSAIAHAILRVLTEETLRAELIGRGLSRARQFTWRNTALQTIDAYSAAIKLCSPASESVSPA